MSALRLAVAGLFVFGLTTTVVAAEKADNKTLIVGVWELTKGESLPPGAMVEFTKDGKLKLTIEIEKKKMTLEGTYEVKGETIALAMKVGDKEEKETLTIKTLTKDELTVVDQKKKSDTFKRGKK